jgi:hypothetical protein
MLLSEWASRDSPPYQNLRTFCISPFAEKMSSSNSAVEFDSLHRLSLNLRSIPERSILPPSASDNQGAPSKSPAQLYFNAHQILENIEIVVNELADSMPTDPYDHLQRYFENLKKRSISKSSESPLVIATFTHIVSGQSDPSSPQKSQLVESKLPADEVDHAFASYLSNLASSVRRGTS